MKDIDEGRAKTADQINAQTDILLERVKNLNIKNTGENKIKCSFNANLKAGLYNFNLGARSSNGFLEYIPSITSIEIIPAKNTNKSNEWDKPSNGLYIMNSDWSIEK